MINDIFKSFFRTIGRILAYILIGAIIAYITGYLKPVSAATLSNNSYFVKVDNHDFPYQTGVGAGGYIRPSIQYYNLSESDVKTAKFNYLILDVCTGSPFGSSNVTIENNGTGNYFDSNSLVIYNTNITCSLGSGYNGTLYKAQMRVGKYVDSEGDGLYAASYLKVINTYGYYTITTFSGSIVSDEDVLTGLAQNNITNDLQRDILNQQKEFNKKQDETNKNLNDLKTSQDKTNDTLNSEDEDTTSKKCGVVCKLKGIFTGIIELPKKIVNLLIDALKSLFIPSDTDFITNFVDSIENKLGFIAEVPIKVIQFGLNLVNASWTAVTSLNFPSVSIMGYYFWEAKEIDITPAINIFKPYKYLTDIACVCLCVATLSRWREKFTGGGS